MQSTAIQALLFIWLWIFLNPSQTKGEETFITTTGTTHDNKWSQNPYKNELYKKAPGHWNQQIYVKDLREKLLHRPHRATLTVICKACISVKSGPLAKKIAESVFVNCTATGIHQIRLQMISPPSKSAIFVGTDGWMDERT